MVNVERDSCWKIWRGVDLYAFVVHDGEMGFRALFRQRGGGGDVIVIVLAVASRTMLQQTVAPNTLHRLCMHRLCYTQVLRERCNNYCNDKVNFLPVYCYFHCNFQRNINVRT